MGNTKEAFILPCGSITHNPETAAEDWAKAFYTAKDTLERTKKAVELLRSGCYVRNLDEILAACDQVLEIGGK